ncbi:MAG: response regulator transcription factor, partial [Betaproteobacteria bacterium]
MPTPILLLAPTPAVFRSLRRQLRGLTPESILAPGGRFLTALPRPLARRVCAFNGAEGRAIRATPQFEVKPELMPEASSGAKPEASSEGSSGAKPARPPTKPQLSRRQLQVLEQLRLGLPNKTIASRLHLSEATVKSHVSAVLRILGAA